MNNYQLSIINHQLLKILLLLCLLPLSGKAQVQESPFVDIEWVLGDTIVPSYSAISPLSADFADYDYTISLDYPETEIATEAEINRYSIDTGTLTYDFPVTTNIGITQKKGSLNISVFPFALRDGKVVKLLNFKPTIHKTAKPQNHKTANASIPAQLNCAKTAKSHSLLSSGKWVKISVPKEGIYQLTPSKLSSMGFSDPSKVRLYGYGLELLPETDIQNIDDDLTEIPLWRKSNGALLFYGCGTTRWYHSDNSSSPIVFTHRNNPYATEICYFLTESTESPAEFKKETTLSGSTSVTTFPDYALIESDEFSYINTGRTFFEKYDYEGTRSHTYNLNLTGYADGDVNLCVRFSAAGDSTSTLRVEANGKRLGVQSLKGISGYTYASIGQTDYKWQNAHAVNDTIKLTHIGKSGYSGHLDYICASYTRKLAMTGSYLLFRPSQSGTLTYTIDGADDKTHVWRVTSPSVTAEIPGSLSGAVFTATASSDDWCNEKFVAINEDASYPQPTVIGPIENQDLHSLSNIDLVIITPANGLLNAQAQRLADAHTAHDSLRCIVVSADKVYNEFSSGTPDATAYRRFMKMLYDRADDNNRAPANLCLFGDGLWDNRMVTSNFSGQTPDDYLLCYESDNSVSHTDSYVLEEYFTLLDDGEGEHPASERPDCGVGRIPVQTESQAKQVVTKLIPYIYNTDAGAWRNVVCMMADDGNSNIHMEDAEAVTSVLTSNTPDVLVKKIYWDSYTREQSATGNSYPAAYADINKQMQDGALVMNYTGHGAAYCLSHEQVLKRADFAEWDSPRMPLWFHAACDVTPFDMNTENIGETAILNEKGGAMAVVSTTRTVYSSQNRKMNLQFMKYVLSDGNTIGEALQKAKDNIAVTSFRDSINKCHFVLLGDPAIRLSQPEYKITVDQFNGKTISSLRTDTIGAGALVTVKGHIADTSGRKATSFNGIIAPTIFDAQESVVCKNNAQEDITPYQFLQQNKVIFAGTDSVRNGDFTFTFTVPIDISYADEAALISLYAVTSDRLSEANGRFSQFVLKGTDPTLDSDTVGPVIHLTLTNEYFTNSTDTSSIVSFTASRPKPQSPTIGAQLLDKGGINTTGGGIGHNISLAIDNDPTQTYDLNSYFQYDTGSHTQGTLTYTIPAITTGTHTLLFRAWDILNNSSSLTITFEVIDDYDSVTIFDMVGRELWSGTGDGYASTLPPGTYILRSGAETKKILIK